MEVQILELKDKAVVKNAPSPKKQDKWGVTPEERFKNIFPAEE